MATLRRGASAFILSALALVALTYAFAPPRGGSAVAQLDKERPHEAALVGLAQSTSWQFCDQGGCGRHTLEQWREDPKSLASQVQDGLISLKGMPVGVFQPIAQHWHQFPPEFRGRHVRLADIATFMRQLLLSDPFGTGQQVPHLDFNSPGSGKLVAVTQRQLAFLVANALMGNGLVSGDGLSAALARCSSKEGKRAYLQSLLSFLAVLSQEIGGDSEAQGTTVIAAEPIKGYVDLATNWKRLLGNHSLREPTVCKKVGLNGESTCGLPDFMSGGTPHQALTDIAGTVVGGGGGLCEVANTQDESLVQFYSEIIALNFFVVTGDTNMLPVPMAFLGVRRYMGEIEGENRNGPPFWNLCGKIRERNWLNQDIHKAGTVDSTVSALPVTLAASSFVAVASVSSTARNDCGAPEAVNNGCANQRDHLDADISLWFRAFSAQQYARSVQQAVAQTVRSIGTGPWGAGVWYGDSQQYFLAVWLATTLVDPTMGLDYYLYDHFCENPSNQCFLLGDKSCRSCITEAAVPDSQVQQNRCGQANIYDLIAHFKSRPAKELYDALSTVGPPPSQVFDLVMPAFARKGRGEPQSPPPRPMITPPAIQPLPTQGNNYRKEYGVGGWGGICTCPDGQTYEVGDNQDTCGSLACEYGKSGPCSAQGIQQAHSGMKVTCAATASSESTSQQPGFQLPQLPPMPTAPPVPTPAPLPPPPPPPPSSPLSFPGWALGYQQVSTTPERPKPALAQPSSGLAFLSAPASPSGLLGNSAPQSNHYRRSPDVGDWGGLCECPDGKLYEVGDNKDYCGSLACENGKAGKCSKEGILSVNRGMKVTCAR